MEFSPLDMADNSQIEDRRGEKYSPPMQDRTLKAFISLAFIGGVSLIVYGMIRK